MSTADLGINLQPNQVLWRSNRTGVIVHAVYPEYFEIQINRKITAHKYSEINTILFVNPPIYTKKEHKSEVVDETSPKHSDEARHYDDDSVKHRAKFPENPVFINGNSRTREQLVNAKYNRKTNIDENKPKGKHYRGGIR